MEGLHKDTYIHTNTIHTYIKSCIHTQNIHTHMHTAIHTYIHTYPYTCMTGYDPVQNNKHTIHTPYYTETIEIHPSSH